MIIKNVSELEIFISDYLAKITSNNEFKLPIEINVDFEIDVLSFATDITNTVIEIEKLPPKIKEYKTKRLVSLKDATLELSEYLESFQNDNSDILEYLELAIPSLQLVGAYGLIRDNIKLLSNEATATAPEPPGADENPHQRIFVEQKHFELFEYLQKQITKNELAEYSFIYWSMHKDSFIYEDVKPTEFINWLNKNYHVPLIELKQLYRVNNGNRPSNYQTAKLLFKC
jgi:hypothetical protein